MTFLMTVRQSRSLAATALVVLAAWTTSANQAAAVVSISYGSTETAMGGWDYAYEGDADAWAGKGILGSLDATWTANREWDGSAPGTGGSSGAGPAPGGIASYTESGVKYLRIQEAGDPKTYAVPFSGQINWFDPSNRRFDLTHSLSGTDIIDSGMTISFRARIATSGTLDDEYRESGSGTFAWPAGGRGSVPNQDGRGQFGISQGGGGGTLGFSLALDSDTTLPPGVGGGLVMNNNPAAPNVGLADATAASQTNVVSLSDAALAAWHDFWITVEDDGGGNWEVNVFKDGTTIPETFTAKKTFTGDHDGVPNLVMGQNQNSATFAIDVDYFTYKDGVVAPLAPTATILAGLMSTGETNGGSTNSGGVDVTFDNVTADGTFTAEFGQITEPDFQAAMQQLAAGAGNVNFALPTDPVSFWDISFDGTFTGSVELTFGYDDSNLLVPAETDLEIYHYDGSSWTALTKVGQDIVANTITVRVNSFSPFALGVATIPEPSTLLLGALAAVGLLMRRRKRNAA